MYLYCAYPCTLSVNIHEYSLFSPFSIKFIMILNILRHLLIDFNHFHVVLGLLLHFATPTRPRDYKTIIRELVANDLAHVFDE